MFHFLFTAENSKGVAVGMIWYETENPIGVFISEIFVYDAFRRMGYGRTIMAELERDLRHRKIPAVALSVFEYNRSAVNLYKKCGYVMDDIRAGKMRMKKLL